jgi:BirA family biotin operon repressor/biotin-[acetyl-CoA-carboxylase] ligase
VSRILRVARAASTNDLAWERPLGGAVVAETQTAGRGRFGRPWHSPPGGLWMSVRLAPRRPAFLTAAAALAAADAVEALSGIKPLIRFPNDLVVGERKLCGLLIEARGAEAVVGIGLNVNVAGFPPELSATSLLIESGRTYDLGEAAEAVLGALDRWAAADPLEVREAFGARSAIVGRRVRINGTIEGTVAAVDPVEGVALTDGRVVVGAHVRELRVV